MKTLVNQINPDNLYIYHIYMYFYDYKLTMLNLNQMDNQSKHKKLVQMDNDKNPAKIIKECYMTLFHILFDFNKSLLNKNKRKILFNH